jgi:hypothetical protein
MAEQTLAVGSTKSRWPSLGMRAVPRPQSLNSIWGLIIGEQNAGKSYLVQSNPEAFVINADDSSIVNPAAEATIWPARDEVNRIVDVDGKPMHLTWDAIDRKRKQLIAMAEANADRPACVVLDTLFPCVRLLKHWVPRQLHKDSWELCHGPAAWDLLYNTLIEFGMSLRNHGYGVWFVAHLSKRWHNINETSSVPEYAISMPEGLRDRLSKTVEMIAPIQAVMERKMTVQKVERRAGDRVIHENKPVEAVEIRRSVCFQVPEFSHLIRTRTIRPIHNVSLDDGNPWEAFSRAFIQATSLQQEIA